MSAPKDVSCVNCLYFDGGYCRRYPPVLVPWPHDNQQPIMYMPTESYPQVGAKDWCGEHKSAFASAQHGVRR